MSCLVLALSLACPRADVWAGDPQPSSVLERGLETATRFKDWSFKQVASGANRVCDWSLRATNAVLPENVRILGRDFHPRKVPERIGHLTFVTPMFRTLQNPNKAWFSLIESPGIGLITTPIASLLAYTLKLAVRPLIGLEITSKDWPTFSEYLGKTWENYLSYNIGNVPRQGTQLLKLEGKLSTREAYWYSWYTSTFFYSLFMAGPVLAKAEGDQVKMVHALSIIVFSGLWPFFSQWVAQNIVTPMLYALFPKDSTIREVTIPKDKTNAELVAAYEAKYEAARARFLVLAGEESISTADLLLPESTSRIEIDTEHPSHFIGDIGLLMKSRRELAARAKGHSTEFLEKLQKAHIDMLSAGKDWGWARWFRSGLQDGQNVPLTKRFHYWGIKTRVSSLVAVVMLTFYYVLQWSTVGPTPESFGVLKEPVRVMYEQVGPQISEMVGQFSDSDFTIVPPTEAELKAASEAVAFQVEALTK